MFYATKEGVTKEVQKYEAEYLQMQGWEITTDGTEKYDPYFYGMANEKGNCLQPIVINGQKFEGYSSFSCINTKTYVEEPSRTLDGSIPNINDYDTILVPRVTISFKYMTLSDFRRFLRAISPNEFVVSYYDYEIDEYVSHKMYCTPREMSKIFNKGYEILAVTEQSVELVGTLNEVNDYAISYFDNVETLTAGKYYEYTQLKTKMAYGRTYTIAEGTNITHTVLGKYRFAGWNTEPGGNGIEYLENEKITATKNLTLYAQWAKAGKASD